MFIKQIAAIDDLIDDMARRGLGHVSLTILRKCLVSLTEFEDLPCDQGPLCECPSDLANALSVTMTAAGLISDVLKERSGQDAELAQTVATKATFDNGLRLVAIRSAVEDSGIPRPTQKGANA